MAARGSRSSTVRFKPATVSQERDRFVLTVGAAKKPIAIGEINDAASVRKLAGKGEVLAAVSGRTIAALGRRVQGCYWILGTFRRPASSEISDPRSARSWSGNT